MHEIRSTIVHGAENSGPVASKPKRGDAGAGFGGLSKIAIKREEARITNHRGEDRLRDVVEDGTIVLRRKKIPVKVVNVSSRGAMIESDIEMRIGEKLDILLGEQAKTQCVVRWLRDGRVGLEFVNETIFWDATSANAPVLHLEGKDAAPAPTGPREVVDRQPRQSLLRNGTLYWSGISIPVRLRNISEGGAQVESDQALREGCEVELDLGEAGFQYAEVRWARDGQVGLRFATEFDLDTLAPRQAVAPAAPDMLKPAYLETETRPDSPWAARFERLTLAVLRRDKSS
jgi:hypothetical protein